MNEPTEQRQKDPAAVALGKLAKGHKKRLTDDQRDELRERLQFYRWKRWLPKEKPVIRTENNEKGSK